MKPEQNSPAAALPALTGDQLDQLVEALRADPAPGFTGYEKRKWGEFGYERECTPEEPELLEAADAASRAEDRAEQEAQRDAWFEELRAELAAAEG